MKIFSKEHEKALKLKSNMDAIEKEHLFHIRHQQKREKQKGYQKSETEAFLRREKIFEEQEDVAYKQYYDHMHKCLDIPKSPIAFNKDKYPNGFVDEKYINDMFKAKANSKKKKRSVKK